MGHFYLLRNKKDVNVTTAYTSATHRCAEVCVDKDGLLALFAVVESWEHSASDM